MGFREIRELALKADVAKGTKREELVKELVERLEDYDLIEDIGWTRIQKAKKVAELFELDNKRRTGRYSWIVPWMDTTKWPCAERCKAPICENGGW